MLTRNNPKRFTKVDNYIFDIGKVFIIEIQGMVMVALKSISSYHQCLQVYLSA